MTPQQEQLEHLARRLAPRGLGFQPTPSLAEVAIGLCCLPLLVGLLGCAAPVLRRDPIGAETHFLASYAERRAMRCTSGGTVFVRHETSDLVVATDPPISSVAWELTTCRETLTFVLECSPRNEVGFRCTGGDWPTPAAPEEWPTGAELAAVARSAPKCPAGRSCRDRAESRCGEDELKMEQVGSAEVGWHGWAVERCGLRRTVDVHCAGTKPYACELKTLQTIDLGGR